MKKLCISIAIILISSQLVFSQVAATINKSASDFTVELTETIMNASVSQNVYADAFIGKFLPSIPPHFAAGINTNVMSLDISTLADAASELNIKIPDSAVLPFFTIDARIGGFFLPFDVGATFIKTPKVSLFGMSADYFTIGADIRYALLEQTVLLPNVSLGVAYYHSEGFFSAKSGSNSIEFAQNMNMLSISAQVSKDILIITPFVGGRFTLVDAENTYKWNTAVAGLNGAGVYMPEFGDKYSVNVYGGVGVNLVFVTITPGVTYDVMNEIVGGTISARFQL